MALFERNALSILVENTRKCLLVDFCKGFELIYEKSKLPNKSNLATTFHICKNKLNFLLSRIRVNVLFCAHIAYYWKKKIPLLLFLKPLLPFPGQPPKNRCQDSSFPSLILTFIFNTVSYNSLLLIDELNYIKYEIRF